MARDVHFADKRWIRYYAAQSLSCANREVSPNEKPDQHPWSKVWDTDPQQEREDKSQNHHIGQGIQKRPDESENGVPVSHLEVLLSEHHYHVEVMADRIGQSRSLPSLRSGSYGRSVDQITVFERKDTQVSHMR